MLSVDVVSVPYDSGRRGWRMGAGPAQLLKHGLVTTLRKRSTDVELIPVELGAAAADELTSAFDLAARIAQVVRMARAAGRFPLVLAGNCFSTVGALAGCDGAVSLAWFDAHADLNTPETSASGFLDGMAAATALGWCHGERAQQLPGFRPLAARDLLLVATRDLDAGEAQAIEERRIAMLSPAMMRSGGARDAIAVFGSGGSVWVHFDLDALDPEQVGSANSFAAPDGISVPEAIEVLETITADRGFAGMTVSAYDPAVDAGGGISTAAIALVVRALELAGRTQG